ncbi:MAG: MMPL family transporter [Alphaproteobacteria bacterium]|nr:MMPL family transporter [Alphaproteobacteria bacterium]MCB9791419.1 MMPL family transporter [Alphaproteobacteria bacterium]
MSAGDRCARLADAVLARPRAALLLALGLALLAALSTFPLRVDGNLLALVSADDPYALALQQARSAPGGEGQLVLSFPEDVDLDAVAARVEALDSVRATFHALDPQLAARLALQQAEPEVTERLAKRLRGALVAPNPFIQQRLLAGVTEELQPPPPLLQPGSLLVVPTRPATDTVYVATLLADLERAAPEATWMAGPHITNAESIRGIREDLLRTSLVSGVLVLLVLALGLKDWRQPLVVLPPVLLGNLLALAGMEGLMGSLNLYSSLGTALLIGLGVDFGVHLSARYGARRAAGESVETAIQWAFRETGPPCVTAALTSAAAFMVLGLSDFRGIQQLGAMLAIGILTCLGATFLLLPLLLRWLDPRARQLGGEPGPLRRPRLGLAAWLLLSVAAGAWGLPRVEIEYDVSALRREGLGWAELSEAQRGLRVQAFPPVVVPVEEGTLAEAQARVEGLIAEGELPRIQRVLSLASLAPRGDFEGARALIEIANDPRAERLPPAVREALAPLAGAAPEPVQSEELPPALLATLGGGRPELILQVKGNLQDLREAVALKQDLLDVGLTGAVSEFLVMSAMLPVLEDELPHLTLLALLAVALLAAVDLRRPALVLVGVGSLLGALAWAAAGLAGAGVRLNTMNVVALPILLGIGIDVVIHLLHRFEDEGSVWEGLRTAGWAAAVSTATTLAAFCSLVVAGNRGVRSVGYVVVIGLSMVAVVAALGAALGWSATRTNAPRSP